MQTAIQRLALILACGIFAAPDATLLAACQESGLQLQVLGSGGPGGSMGRASSAYVLWVDGESRVLIDTGSGSKNLFHQSGATMAQVELIALSHLHPDHSVELPGILWPAGGEFALAGPQGNEDFPSITQFVEGLFGVGGVYEILGSRIDIDVIELNPGQVSPVWQSGDISISGMGVPHGTVPTIGYRVDTGNASIAFASDQNGSKPEFVDFIRDVDVLVIHLAVGEGATGQLSRLHAAPSVWGQMAEAAAVKQLVVSHISTSDPAQLTRSLDVLAANYSGMITVAEDLLCVDLP